MGSGGRWTHDRSGLHDLPRWPDHALALELARVLNRSAGPLLLAVTRPGCWCSRRVLRPAVLGFGRLLRADRLALALQALAHERRTLARVQGTIDYLVTGGGDAKAKEGLKDAQLLKQFQLLSALPEKERTAMLRVIEAFVRDAKAKEAYA